MFNVFCWYQSKTIQIILKITKASDYQKEDIQENMEDEAIFPKRAPLRDPL